MTVGNSQARGRGRRRSGSGASLSQIRGDAIWLLLSLALLLAAWETLVRAAHIPAYFLPGPLRVGVALWNGFWAPLMSRQGFYLHIFYTLTESLAGFAIGGSLGVIIGTILSHVLVLRRLVMPYVVGLQSLPKIALVPLFVIWLGFGMASKIVTVSLLTFFPTLINSMAGFDNVETDRLEMIRSVGASPWQIFRFVKLPSALPYIFAGLDVAIVFSLSGAVVGEFMGAETGLGVLILQRNFAMDMAGTFSTFMLLALMGIVLSRILRMVRRHVLFWAPVESRVVGV